MKKIVLQLDPNTNQVLGLDGTYIGMMTGTTQEALDTRETVMTLVKQGLTTEDIVKLKNNDLI